VNEPMIDYYYADEDGAIYTTGTTTQTAFEQLPGNPKIGSASVDLNYEAAGVLRAYTPEQLTRRQELPSEPSKWSNAIMDWVSRLSDVQRHARAATAVRSSRDALLQQSDWTQLPDVPLATKSAWAEYRQALRSITSQAGFPTDVVWPTPPQ
jgi:hypothetical protein